MPIFWGSFAPPGDGVFAIGAATQTPPAGQGDPATGLLTAPYTAVTGDIYVQGTTQSRWNGTIWVALPHADHNRGDVTPSGGALNDRVTKLGGQAFRTTWRSSADGVMQMWNQMTPLQTWSVNHLLTARMVDVQVITPGYSATVAEQGRIASPGAAVPLAPDQIILIPDVEYTGVNDVTLIFTEPVAGTAIVRR
ncbi:MAG: hypothetical protein C5B60_02610 [Chloroflexi bacterium]|nr:MAG: hypothetical protein C5B60_02610 [Chloroflexota bacterium]